MNDNETTTTPLYRTATVTMVALSCLGIGLFALVDAAVSAFPVSIRPLINPDGGLATALLGLALLFGCLARTHSARLAALALFGVAATSPWRAFPGSMPDAMALMFAFLALSLLASGCRNHRLRNVARFLAWLTVLSGSAFLLTGWLTPLPEALFTHTTTAVIAGLVVTAGGAGILVQHRLHRQSPMRFSRLPLATGILGSLLAVSGWYFLSSQSLQRLEGDVAYTLSHAKTTIRHDIEDHVQLLQRLVGRWETLGRIPAAPLRQHELDSYLDDFPSLDFIAVLDDEFQFLEGQSHHPELDDDEIVNTLSSASVATWLPDSPAARRALHSTAIRGSQGENWLLLALPLSLSSPHWLVSSLDVATLLERHESHTGPFHLQVAHAGEMLFDSLETTADQALQAIDQQHIELPGGGEWTLTAALPRSRLQLSAVVPTLTLLSGLLFTYLLMISLGLNQLSRERRHRLNASHRALEQTMKQRDQFFTLSLELFCRVDLEGRFLQVNPAFQQSLGFSHDQLIGSTYGRLIHPDDQPLIAQAIQALAGGDRIQQLEARVIDARDETHWVEINAALGDESVIYAVARDVTLRKQAEAQQVRDRRLFRIVGRTAQIGGWYFDLSEGRPIWSDEVCAIHDEPAGFQPTLEQAIAYYKPAYRERLQQAFETCVREGKPIDDVFEIVTAKGRHRYVRVIGEAMRNEQGEIIRAQGSTQDITERKRLQDEVHQLAERLTTTLESITDGFFTLDAEWRFSYLNHEAERLLQRSRQELLGQDIWQAFPEAEGTLFETEYRRAVADGISVTFEEYNPRLDLWVEVHAYPSDEGLAVYFQNINARKAAERQLRILERGIESSVNGVVIADAQQPGYPIVYANAAFEKITGYTREEVIGHNCRMLQGENTDPDAKRALRLGIEARRTLHVTLLNYRKDGSPFWNDLYISPVFDDPGEVTHFIGIQNDISTQREYESRLAYHASHDALTGLPNRALLEDRLAQSSQFAHRYARSLAVLFVDLDDFKPINDTLGHEVGDHILIEVARRLEAGVRPGDTVARFGGDEFVILLPDLAHQDDVLPIVERLLDSVARPYRDGDSELRLTASIGIALRQDDDLRPTRLIQQADLAMYKAKRHGRNTYQWFTQDLNHKVSQRVTLRNALQRAIEEEQFELHYQPQIHGASGSVIGFEALIRWRHPERGYVSPMEFIGLAEDTGQIIPISDWVLATACRDNRHLNELGLGPLVMSANVSPMQFQRSRFVSHVQDTLATTGLAPELLELELTEGVLMDGSEGVIDTLHVLREQGIKIAIDDFGTGFSSLSYLKQLPIDKIKIDRSFIREVISDHRDAAIVKGIISMASSLPVKVVAEGVETQAQHAFLQKLPCDIYQGYYFARPMPLDELEGFLHQNRAAQRLRLARENGEAGKPTVLLLDDEANILNALTRTLRRDGYRILATERPQQAFELLATEDVQVIISDQRMPEMSGTEFLRRVKELHPDTIQIVLSGYTDLKTVTTAINEGAIFKFLTKPWDDEELRLVVQQAFRKAALMQVQAPS
ncbi:PAS domain S-box-containing protein/diguanylate cyclase (GGDEF) domain-containing protein [Billgrantia gudaonensis]|uniref:cyclic-guanylate-specific phosphodiesterase n=1 Tax=Billgrantia gudaonensis TaxID=376427 RepID=A0A1G8ZQ83_9GAMM|nr:PAS domain S-box-containing protein/diguanylate cyclase (GGDEF) domain-containing protein [Halomonas gudaonensis]